MRLKKGFLVFLFFCFAACAFGQDYFPDVKGRKTLVCDFHTHTVFSDGQVWPDVRIVEAFREGLDVIAITDHIEYQKYKADLPINLNRSYEIALPKAKENNILLIKGAEITKSTPPGHYNAIFINDVEPLNNDKLLGAVRNAKSQKAFVFWNHHAWKGQKRGAWEDIQTQMYNEKLFQGMEVANGRAYYPQALKWCIEKGLTIMGDSDIHTPSIDYQYTPYQHRTLTLVFAAGRNEHAVKQALMAGKTAAWYKNEVIGREENLRPLFNSVFKLSKPHYVCKNTAYLEIENTALLNLYLKRVGKTGPSSIYIPAKSKIILEVDLDSKSKRVKLEYQAKNFRVGPEAFLKVELEISNADAAIAGEKRKSVKR